LILGLIVFVVLRLHVCLYHFIIYLIFIALCVLLFFLFFSLDVFFIFK